MAHRAIFFIRVGIVVAFGGALLIAAAGAEAFKVKTNRSGECTVNPITRVQGDQVTYGVEVRNCNTRNGIRRVASVGFAIEGRQIVSLLHRKAGLPPYSNMRTSSRTLPDEVDLPPILPGLPLPDLPILDIPILDELPILGDDDPSAADRTYTRIDYSLILRGDKGMRQRRKPERWQKRAGCEQTTTRRSNDTLVCQSFAVTS